MYNTCRKGCPEAGLDDGGIACGLLTQLCGDAAKEEWTGRRCSSASLGHAAPSLHSRAPHVRHQRNSTPVMPMLLVLTKAEP